MIVPRPTFDIPWSPWVGFCSGLQVVASESKCELSTDLRPAGGGGDIAVHEIKAARLYFFYSSVALPGHKEAHYIEGHLDYSDL